MRRAGLAVVRSTEWLKKGRRIKLSSFQVGERRWGKSGSKISQIGF
jgi:hypothetical protein